MNDGLGQRRAWVLRRIIPTEEGLVVLYVSASNGPTQRPERARQFAGRSEAQDHRYAFGLDMCGYDAEEKLYE